MFVTQRKIDAAIEYMERECQRVDERYWKLYHKHERLLRHLGLHEETVPEKTELRTKDGPERNDS